jgi:hypothetical protein
VVSGATSVTSAWHTTHRYTKNIENSSLCMHLLEKSFHRLFSVFTMLVANSIARNFAQGICLYIKSYYCFQSQSTSNSQSHWFALVTCLQSNSIFASPVKFQCCIYLKQLNTRNMYSSLYDKSKFLWWQSALKLACMLDILPSDV